MSVLTPLQDMGVTVQLSESGNLKIKGSSSVMDKPQIDAAISYAKRHKTELISALSQHGQPGECESCPAAGYYDRAGGGLQCFFTAYYLHKSGKSKPCSAVRSQCPRNGI